MRGGFLKDKTFEPRVEELLGVFRIVSEGLSDDHWGTASRKV